MCVTGCAGSSTASLAWKRREVPFWESHPGSPAFRSCKPSWLSVDVDAELLQQGDWIEGCYEAHESRETHQGNPGLPFTWQQFSYFVIIWLGTCLIWFISLFCTKPTRYLHLWNLRKFPLCILPATKCLWHLLVTSGKAVRATAAAVVRRDCHETAVFRKAFALSGQTALQLSGIHAVLC